VTFTTASLHCQAQEPNWLSLVKASRKQTLVFYMGLGKIALIAKRLIEHGLDPQYPIAVIDKACTRQQSVVKGSLCSISMQVLHAHITGPAIIVCGEVVNHQQSVSTWAQYMQAEEIIKHSLKKRANNVQIAV
jgi:siroheme synthase